MATKPIRSTADVPGLVDALSGKQATLSAELLAALGITDPASYFAAETIGGQMQELGRFGQVLADTTLLSTVASGDWSVDASTNVITCSLDHGYAVNDAIAFAAGAGALPAGISPEPEYYWVVSVPTTKTMTISAAYGGAALDITDAGTAGWQVKALPLSASGTGHLYSGFSLRALKQLDIYWVCSWAKRNTNGNYPAIGLASTQVYPSSTTFAAGIAGAGFSGAMFAKKYNKALMKLSLRLIDENTAGFTFTAYGMTSGVANYASDVAGVGTVGGGVILMPSDLTSVRLYDGYGGKLLSGARMVAVRGSWL